MSFGLIKRDKADELFSRWIRERDKWQCVRCSRKHDPSAGTLGNSHYWSRRHEKTRYDLENCDSICNSPCHRLWGGDYRDEYKAFKVRQLGKTRYDLLDKRHWEHEKKDRKKYVMAYRVLLLQDFNIKL